MAHAIEIPTLDTDALATKKLSELETSELFDIFYTTDDLPDLTWSGDAAKNLGNVLSYIPKDRGFCDQTDKKLSEQLFGKSTPIDILVEIVLRIGALKRQLPTLKTTTIVGFTEIIGVFCRELVIVCFGEINLSVDICALLEADINVGTTLLFGYLAQMFTRTTTMYEFRDNTYYTNNQATKRARIAERIANGCTSNAKAVDNMRIRITNAINEITRSR
jgi:hypothetical protein